ncbi:imelysin family protein [Chryseolinea sp. T2]|uniref:imelysin family protein n=1 Tax=Chryseolinea sp. T2 TaxID=3129255 RepID=UPI0030786D81
MSLFQFKKIGVVLGICILSGCGGSSDPDPAVDPLDRVPMLTNWADNIIIPAYDNFNAKLGTMTTKADAFTSTPNETTLAGFRTSWKDAYIDWQRVELFEFGPGDRNTIRNFFNIYPADEAGIVQNISDPAVNLALPVSYARQGFPALDYLINGLADSDQGIITLYTTDSDASKRIAYIDKLVDRMNSLLTTVISDWKGSYRSTFISSTGLDIGSSTSNVVNAYTLNYERFIRSGKIGIPSGAMTTSGGVKYPEKVEAYYKRDISLTLAKTAHQATVDFFNGKGFVTGTEGPSLKSYLDALDAKDVSTGTPLSQIINNQFSSSALKFDLLGENLHDQVINNNQSMIDTYNELQKAVRMLKVDMTSAMSITITYTDNDGD